MNRRSLLVLVLTALAAELLSATAAAAPAGAELAESPKPLQHANASSGRKLLQPFTLGLPLITRASDSAGRVNERSIARAGNPSAASLPCNSDAALCEHTSDESNG
jgi:hypothetical protein